MAIRPIALTTLLLAGLFAAGCLTVEETIVLDKDGSGAVVLQYAAEEALLPAMGGAQDVIQEWQESLFSRNTPPRNWMFNETLVRDTFRKDGVTVKEYVSSVAGGRRTVRVVCAAPDMQKALAGGMFGDFTYIKTEQGEFRLRINMPVPPPDAVPPDDATVARIKAATKGLKIVFAVQTPSKILEAAGAEVTGNVARWTFDAERDDSFLRASPRVEVRFAGPAPDATAAPAAAPAP